MANLQAFERSEYQQVKADLHRKILDRLDLEKLGRTAGDSARAGSCRARSSTKSSDWPPSSRCSKIPPFPTFWSTASTVSTSNAPANWKLPACLLRTTSTPRRESTASAPAFGL